MDPEPPIHFQGTLRFEQYRAALGLHQTGVLPTWLVAGLLVGVATLAGAAMLWIGDRGVGALCLGLAALFLAALGARRWMIRRSWDTYALMREPVRGSLSAEGLAIEGAHGSGRIPWDRLFQWKASATLLLIYPSNGLFHILPRDFFESPESWTAATALAAARLPSRRKRQRLVFLGLMGLGLVVVIVVSTILVLMELAAAP